MLTVGHIPLSVTLYLAQSCISSELAGPVDLTLCVNGDAGTCVCDGQETYYGEPRIVYTGNQL